MGLDAERPDEPEAGFGVREDPHHPGTAFNLLIQPFQHICGFEMLVVRPGQAVEGQGLADMSFYRDQLVVSLMRSLLLLFIHALTTFARLPGPGGMRSAMAESLLIKHQRLVINRSRHRAPVLSPVDQICMG